MSTSTRQLDRVAVGAIVLHLLILVVVTLVAHPIPLYGVETDLLGDSIPAARSLREGGLTAETFLFRGPGYPLLLAVSSLATGGDAFLAARLLNLVAAAAAAAAAYRLVRGLLGPAVALGSLLALLVNPVFVRAVIEAGSDMPAMALSLFATSLVVRGGGWRSFAAAGFVSGFAYLTRYNAVFLIPAALLGIRAGRGDTRGLLAWVAAFALPVAGWMLIQTIITGELPRNDNHLNVAYEVYGRGMGWDLFWTQTGSPFGSFLDVVRYDPVRFAQHVGRNFATRWLMDTHQLMPVWIGVLAVPGMVVTWWRRPGWPTMMLHFGLAYSVLTLVFYTPRFFLYLLPFYLAGAFGLLLRTRLLPLPGVAVPVPRVARRWQESVGIGAAAALLVVSAAETVGASRKLLRDAPTETRAGGEMLRALGRPGERVMARKPHVAYYAGMRYVPLPYHEVFTDFLAAARSTGADYLFISLAETALRPQLSVLAEPEVSLPGLLPLAHGVLDTTRRFAVYRFVPSDSPESVIEDSLLVAIRRFAARRPGEPWPQTYLGGQLVTMRRYREALGALAEAERLAPGDALVARFQSIAHVELGDFDAAAAACERALRLAPSGGWEEGYLGHIRLLQGRHADAREALRRALHIEPANARYLEEYLRACTLGEHWSDAIEAAEQLLRANPEAASARLFGARAWLRLGRPEKARGLVDMPGAVSGPDSAAFVAFADSLRSGAVPPLP